MNHPINSEFNYIIKKIQEAEFISAPFAHLYIEDFLSAEHLRLLQTSPQLLLEIQESTENLIAELGRQGYQIQEFPGCFVSTEHYLEWYNSGETRCIVRADVVESAGLAFRLIYIRNQKIIQLREFLNSEQFHNCLRDKFSFTSPTSIQTEIQKYLTGYEISPHPDNRKKALTYLLNINTTEQAEAIDIHTHLLSFVDEYQWVQQHWATVTDNSDRCWVPWSWCKTEKIINKNNSLIMFAPGNNTLHSAKLDYDHLPFQRTQFYGNLWYKNSSSYQQMPYSELLKLQS